MKPVYLYINNFTCHQASEIDFTHFSSALIVGRQDNNERVSSGMGKTSIFKAIEYVLFNQVRDPLQEKDILLEDLILEGTDKCKVVLDIEVKHELFRIVRSRTNKNISDLSFYRRSTINDNRNVHTPETDKELWIDISSRRTQDTEIDIAKTIRTHHKAFINTSYFMQFDFGSGLAANTPANRKAILREALDLLIYAKLEKIAKTNADNILKEIDRAKMLLTTLGNPSVEIIDLQSQDTILGKNSLQYKEMLQRAVSASEILREEREKLTSQLSVLEDKSKSVFIKRDSVLLELNKINASIIEYSTKRKSIILDAKQLMVDVGKLKDIKTTLDNIDFSKLESIKADINAINIEHATIKSQIFSVNEELVKLNIPMPSDGTCKHCRQPLTDEHRQACLKNIAQDIKALQEKISGLHQISTELMNRYKTLNSELKDLEPKHKTYADTILQIASYEKNITDKKSLHAEYSILLDKFNTDLNLKNEELTLVKIDISNSSEQEINELRSHINENTKKTKIEDNNSLEASRFLNDTEKQRAILQHTIVNKEKDVATKVELENTIERLTAQYTMYPFVIQAFGSTGIPSLIIQNILEDLQAETNNLLAQLRPGLQLSFKIEKTKDDGTKDDTLDIEYYLNNKPRRYSMLSGGQKVCIMFCLKLGLSFLLKKMLGSQINLLLIDEIDQPFDDSGVDAFADIIKLFQKDFTILVITHRNRLKEYFKDIIVVDQGQDMISNAKVIST